MDVTSLYTNIPQDDGIQTVCNAYENFHNNNPPIPCHYLKQTLGLILKENSFEFKGENYLQTQGAAMGTKMAVAFANIFIAEIKTNLLNQSRIKPIAWKRYIDDVFSLWGTKRELGPRYIHSTSKQISPNEKIHSGYLIHRKRCFDTVVYIGVRFETESIFDIKTH